MGKNWNGARTRTRRTRCLIETGCVRPLVTTYRDLVARSIAWQRESGRFLDIDQNGESAQAPGALATCGTSSRQTVVLFPSPVRRGAAIFFPSSPLERFRYREELSYGTRDKAAVKSKIKLKTGLRLTRLADLSGVGE